VVQGEGFVSIVEFIVGSWVVRKVFLSASYARPSGQPLNNHSRPTLRPHSTRRYYNRLSLLESGYVGKMHTRKEDFTQGSESS
jgi:hypothetical protein